jgi:hypothetical protein
VIVTNVIVSMKDFWREMTCDSENSHAVVTMMGAGLIPPYSAPFCIHLGPCTIFLVLHRSSLNAENASALAAAIVTCELWATARWTVYLIETENPNEIKTVRICGMTRSLAFFAQNWTPSTENARRTKLRVFNASKYFTR